MEREATFGRPKTDSRRRETAARDGQNMITLSEAPGDARRQQLAVGHFNVSDLVALKAVTEAARELKVPVFIETSEGAMVPQDQKAIQQPEG